MIGERFEYITAKGAVYTFTARADAGGWVSLRFGSDCGPSLVINGVEYKGHVSFVVNDGGVDYPRHSSGYILSHAFFVHRVHPIMPRWEDSPTPAARKKMEALLLEVARAWVKVHPDAFDVADKKECARRASLCLAQIDKAQEYIDELRSARMRLDRGELVDVPEWKDV